MAGLTTQLARPASGLALTIALALLAAGPLRAQPQSEARLKAQILVKALSFVEWPGTALAVGQPLQLCLAEDGLLALELRAFDGHPVGPNPLAVRVVRNRQFGGCQVVLAGEAQSPFPMQPATLWVTEAAGMLERGGMLSLQVEDGRIVFDVGLDTVRRAGLDVSAKLLRLARFVKKG